MFCIQQEEQGHTQPQPYTFPLPSAQQMRVTHSLGIHSFPVVHEVTGHLEGKAHWVVLPHSLHHSILIVLQERSRVTPHLLAVQGPGVENPAFLDIGKESSAELQGETQDSVPAWTCTHCGKQAGAQGLYFGSRTSLVPPSKRCAGEQECAQQRSLLSPGAHRLQESRSVHSSLSPGAHSSSSRSPAHLGHPSTFSWHSPGTLERQPWGLTCVILMTSLTKAMAFSGWNLQVPFCGDREELLEPVAGPAVPWGWGCEYLGPVGVAVLPHQPFVVQDVLEGLAGQAPAGHTAQSGWQQFIRMQ